MTKNKSDTQTDAATDDECCCDDNGNGETTATLLLSEDFAGEQLTSEDLTFWSSTPDAYCGGIKPVVTFEGTTCGHYYAQKGTNEKTPWQVMVERPDAEKLVQAETFDEFCIEWKEYFVGGYPWPHGQKMFRVTYNHSQHPESSKLVELACLSAGQNMQFAAYWGVSGQWFQNSGVRHPENVWVTWRVWVKLNAPSTTDGFIRIAADGVPVLTAEELQLREEGDARGFNQWWLGGNYSAEGGVGGLASDGHRYITGIRWWSTNPDGN